MLTFLKCAGIAFDTPPFVGGGIEVANEGRLSRARKYFLENYNNVVTWLVCLYILILPTRFLTTIKDFLCISCLCLWFGRMVLEKKLLFKRTPLDIPILIFGALIVASIFTSISPWKTADQIRGEFLKVFAVFYFSVNNINTTRQIKTVITCIVWTSLIYALYSVTGSTLLGVHVVGKGGLIDFPGGQVAGLFINIFIGFLIASFCYTNDIRKRVLLSFIIFANIAALYVASTRAAVVALFFQLILFFRDSLKKVALVILGFVCLLIMLPCHSIWHGDDIGIRVFHDFFHKSPEELYKGGSTTDRIASYKYHLSIIKKNPLYPHGWGRFYASKRKLLYTVRSYDPLSAYLSIWFQLGLQGLLVFIFLFYKLIRIFWVNKDDENGALFAGFLLMTVGFAVNIAFGDFYGDSQALMLWLLSGMGVGLYLNPEKVKVENK
ncbi:MAG: O-antigen ligase family protein [Deltaproteobacteria bacterium]|nr:O-antigen ligase family protein [Deltaproteobacteria bacterium]